MRESSLIGLGLAFIGFAVLVFSKTSELLDVGLVLVAFGRGIVSPNVMHLVQRIYGKDTDTQRRNATTYFHAANTLGQTLGPLALTKISMISISSMFCAAAAGTLLGFFAMLFLLFYPEFKTLETKSDSKKSVSAGLLFLAIILFFAFPVFIKEQLGELLIFTGIILLIVSADVFKKANDIGRIKIKSFFLIMLGSIAGQICLWESMTILNFFTENWIDRFVFNVQISAGMFQSIEPAFVFIFSFVLNHIRSNLKKKNIEMSSMKIIFLGLMCLAFSSAILFVSVFFAEAGKIPMAWLFGYYGVMAIGELLVLPIAAGAALKTCSENWSEYRMGILYFSGSVAAFLTKEICQMILPEKGSASLQNYGCLSGITAFGLAILAGILLIFWQMWGQQKIADQKN